MQVFHYVANQTKHMPLWESSSPASSGRIGAIYNDIDNDPAELLHSQMESRQFSFRANSSRFVSSQIDQSEIMQKKVDHAVLWADENEGLGYNDLIVNCPYWDIESEADDIEYLKRVFLIASHDATAWENITPLTKKAEKLFTIRQRNNWEGPDSMYDAWLLLNREKRDWFRYDLFYQRYPKYDVILQDLEDKFKPSQSDSSSTESDYESTSDESEKENELTSNVKDGIDFYPVYENSEDVNHIESDSSSTESDYESTSEESDKENELTGNVKEEINFYPVYENSEDVIHIESSDSEIVVKKEELTKEDLFVPKTPVIERIEISSSDESN